MNLDEELINSIKKSLVETPEKWEDNHPGFSHSASGVVITSAGVIVSPFEIHPIDEIKLQIKDLMKQIINNRREGQIREAIEGLNYRTIGFHCDENRS